MNRLRLGMCCAAVLLPLSLMGCGSKESGQVVTTEQATGDSSAVRIAAEDRWTISGDIFKPEGISHGAVLLLHQRGGSGDDWHALCVALKQAGYTALSIDQRGTGRSAQGPGQSGEYAPWDTSKDISAGLFALKDSGPAALIGASYGANNALIYAAAHPNQVKSVVLFSPGKNYHGLDAVAAARKFSGSMLTFHDKDDKIAGSGPAEIDGASGAKEHFLKVGTGAGHGTALLNTDVTKQTVEFLTRTLK